MGASIASRNALAAYQETLCTARTPFDDFRDALLRGDVAAAVRYPALHRWRGRDEARPAPDQIDDLQAFLASLGDVPGERRPPPVAPIACP